MLSSKNFLVATILAAASLASQASTVNLAADGQWNAFTVDAFSSASGGAEWIDGDDSNAPGFGSALNYSFTIAAGQQGTLTVVDANFAGDTFQVFNLGVALGLTSQVPAGVYGNTADVGNDYDAALSNAAFSRGVFTLAAGTYSISGVLAQSVLLDDGSALNATGGALRLDVSPVPEPSTGSLVLAALGVAWLLVRRTSSR
jgi:hypothetical protein